MIYLKLNPVGVDVVINDIQRQVSTALNWTDYNAYHRIYKIEKAEGGIIPEFYTGENEARSGEYEEVYLNDNLMASSFFYSQDTVTANDGGHLMDNTISMVFQVDLNRLNGDNKRADEHVHRDVIRAINDSGHGKVSSLVTKLSNVYSEFDITQIRWNDMQPFHCFRVDIAVNYQFDCCDDCMYQSPITGNDYIFI
ncbi:MAG: hypothetical protein COA36_16620 [Desulfotalea sp.]|nr:MAG: hypothetical protein COA36_16620 [Desulfotalea sp.]